MPRSSLRASARLRASVLVVGALVAGCDTDPLAPAAAPAPGPAVAPAAARRAAGRYLVLLRRGRVAAGADAAVVAERTVARVGGGGARVRRAYGHALAGFAAELTDSAVAALRADPDVAVVEPDPVVHATETQAAAPWGLDRIDQAALPLSGDYSTRLTGAGVPVYILDTGIRLDHAEFGGRAVAGADFVTPGGSAGDCHGHGTHVAGTVGGATYGVAKGASLVAVRVLDCAGSGSGSDVVAALDWVVQRKQANPGTPAVVNLSLSGDASAVLDSAVERAAAAGVTVVAAAGNAGADACAASPGRAAAALTLGATSAYDVLASFSNWGPCVDLLAPGVLIRSAGIASRTSAVTRSGTSMAAPHAAGAAALYLGVRPSASPAQVAAALTGGAATPALGALHLGTPGRLLGVQFLEVVAAAAGPVVNADGGQCLHVVGGSRASGARLDLTRCAGYASQAWTAPPLATAGELRVYGSMCLAAPSATPAAGQRVVIRRCAGATTTRWARSAAGVLRGPGELCLAPSGAATRSGVPLVLQACTGAAAQRWTTPGPAPR